VRPRHWPHRQRLQGFATVDGDIEGEVSGVSGKIGLDWPW
jgi:hypothetical protein